MEKRVALTGKSEEGKGEARRKPGEDDVPVVLLVAALLIAGTVAQASLVAFLFVNGGKDGLLRLLEIAGGFLGG